MFLDSIVLVRPHITSTVSFTSNTTLILIVLHERTMVHRKRLTASNCILLQIHRVLSLTRSSPSSDAPKSPRTSVISNHDANSRPCPGPRGPRFLHLSSESHCRNETQHLQPHQT